MRKRKNTRKYIKYIVVITCFVITILLMFVFKRNILNYNGLNKINIKEIFNIQNDKVNKAKYEKEKKPKIYSGNSRNVAVMVSNEKAAWPQAGLLNAYMIYECIIEGGETRFMALYKADNLPEKIGPVRSSRHYYLDYAAEHDPIYAHFGWSDLAMQRIKQRGVQNINGIYDKYYYREGGGYNNAFVSKNSILDFAKQKGYPLTTNREFPLKLSGKNVDIEGENICNNLKLTYSQKHNVTYKYDAENKVYLRSMRGINHIDRVTKEQIKAKNIVVLKVKNFNLNDYVGSPRQDLNNIGSGEGYYITNGKYTKITWNKSQYNQNTVIKDLNGKEIILNDGLTFMQIVPDKYNVEIY